MEVVVFIMGLLLGSFYNVVGLRLPKKESIVKPGSHCPNCQHALAWYENIPVISYLILRGKCKSCKKYISLMYPAMELLTAILFLLSFNLFGLSENFYLSLIISSLLILIFITDSIYMIILDESLIVAIILVFIVKFCYLGLVPALLSLGSGLLIFAGVYLLMLFGNFLFKKESLGGGDIKLSFVAGMLLGPALGWFYIIMGAFLAFPYAVYVSIKNEDPLLPFGPFLITSLFLCFCNSGMIMEFLKKLLGII